MIISIHQPNYLPYLGFFDKIMRSNKFIIYDDAQFVKGDFHNRNRIRTSEGFQWLTVPIRAKLGQRINEVKIDNMHFWAKKHLKSIIANYEGAPFYNRYIKDFEDVYNKKTENLVELNMNLIQLLLRLLKITTPILMSTELGPFKSKSTEKLIELCKIAGGTAYLAGGLAKNYMDESLFQEAGIKVEHQNFAHPTYRQNFKGFIPNMSAIDLLFNCGEKSSKIICNG